MFCKFSSIERSGLNASKAETPWGILNGSNMVKSIVVVQHSRDESFKINGFSCYKHKTYGRTALTFLVKE
jgi:16S rRNA G966 N2-methylase RsmD